MKHLRAPLSLSVAAAAFACAASASAQTWVPVQSGAPAGKPAELRLDASASNASSYTVELEIFGFWRESVLGGDGLTYDRLTFPGLGEVGQLGAPELPAARPRLGVPSDAVDLILGSTFADPAFTQSFTYDVYPTPVPAQDGGSPLGPGDPDGEDEVFVVDTLLYGTDANFPTLVASAAPPVTDTWDNLRSGVPELFPVRFNPVKRRLTVDGLTRYTYRALGSNVTRLLTRDKRSLAAAAFLNWPPIAFAYPANAQAYRAHYLIVTPQAYVDALAPFVLWKKQLGLVTEVVTLESLPQIDCDTIRAAIEAWFTALPADADKYCLLVGDEPDLPLCVAPTPSATRTDDPYGSPTGIPDLDEEVLVGRLSAKDEVDVALQVAKWIAYEQDGTSGNDYSVVLLPTHKDPGGGLGSYEEAAVAVQSQTYSVPPQINVFPGSQPLLTDALLLGFLDSGVGYWVYRGHGTANAWPDWNSFGENLHRDEVLALTNSQPPVVWSFACNHGNIAVDTSLGEAYLRADGGGVAHYGATGNGGRKQNNALMAAMFEAVFDDGVKPHAMAIALAEDRMDRAFPLAPFDNAWMGSLLGDPSLQLRRAKPNPGTLLVPGTIQVGQSFTVQALGPGGTPVIGAQLAAYKPPFLPDGSDEFQWTGYTGTSGSATIPGPTTLGAPLGVTEREDDGNVIIDGGVVSQGAFTDLGDGLPGFLGYAPTLASGSSLQPGSSAKLDLAFGVPFAPGVLGLSAFDNPTPVFGGVLHPVPVQLEVSFQTGIGGAWTLDVDPWPGLPPGATLIWQAGLFDAGAPEFVALSNALRSVSP